MPSFYFLWDPTKYPKFREELREAVPLLAVESPWSSDWSTGNCTKTDFPPGSRFFMVRQANFVTFFGLVNNDRAHARSPAL